MNPQFVERGPIQVIGVLACGKPDQLDYRDIWQNRYARFDAQLQPYSPDKAYYGAWLGEGEQGIAYLAGLAVEGLGEVPEGLVLRVLPAARYAMFPCTIGTLGKTYNAIWQEWLPASDYLLDETKSDFEYYPPNPGDADPPAAIFIPVKQKEPAAAG